MKKLLFGLVGVVCALFAVPAHAALPGGYTQLEYINLPTSSYLQTNVIPVYNGHYEMDFRIKTFVVGSAFLGGRTAVYPAGLVFASNSEYNVVLDAFSSARYVSTYTLLNDIRLKYVFDNQKTTIYRDNTIVVTKAFDGTNANGAALCINGINDNGNTIGNSASIDLYSFNAWNSKGNLIANLIPAKRNSDGAIGMYDTVGERFYENAGSGSFIAGPIAEIKVATTKYVETQFGDLGTRLAAAVATVNTVVTNTINQAASIATLQSGKQTRPADETCPAGKKCLLVEGTDGKPHWYEICGAHCLPAGYTELEYIQSTGTQWIDTGIVPSSDLMVEYTFQTTNYSSNNISVLFGSSIGTAQDYPTDTQIWISGGLFNVAHCTPINTNIHYCTKTADTAVHTVIWNSLSGGQILFDGTSIGSYLPYNTSNNKSMYIAISNHPQIASYNNFTQRVYSATFTNKTSGALVRNFVPAKNASGVVGMYDLVNDRFYTNAGTGTFTAGPVAE